MSKDLKKKVIKTIVWRVALYGSETLKSRKYDRDRSVAFEIWTWRNMKDISWKDIKTNEYALGLVKEKKKFLLERKKTMAWTHLERRDSRERSK